MSNVFGREIRYGSPTKDQFAGDTVETVFALSKPATADTLLVVVDGVVLTDGYSVAGTALTLSDPPAAPTPPATYNVYAYHLATVASARRADWRNAPIGDNVGGADAISVAYNPAVASYTDNLLLWAVLSSPNLTTAPTFSANGLPPKTVFNGEGNALTAGALKGTVLFRYESTGDKFVVAGGGAGGSGGVTDRNSVASPTVTTAQLDLEAYAAFDLPLTANTTIQYPAAVPDSGVWYIDITVDATGGWTLTWDPSYTLGYGYVFDAVPSSRWRAWLTASATGIDVTVERLV